MDFGKIISRAWRIVKSRRYLWYLGILAFVVEGGSWTTGLFIPQPPLQYTTRAPHYDSSGDGVSTGGEGIGGVLGVTDSRELGQLFPEVLPAIVAILVLTALLLLLLVYLANACRAGLIRAVNRLEDKGGEESCLSAFRAGRRFAWRLFGLDLIINLLVLLAILAVSSPLVIALSFQAGIAAYAAAGLVAFAGFFAIIALSIFLNISGKWASREIVAGGRVMESFAQGRQLARVHLKESIFAWLIDLCFWSVVFVAVLIISLFVGGILFGFGVLVGIASVAAAVVYAIIVGLALLVVAAIFNGACTSFISSFWTLAWRALGRAKVSGK